MKRRMTAEQWEQLIGRRRGRPLFKLSAPGLIILLVFHFSTSFAGTLADHLLLFGLKMSESSLSERRQSLPRRVFEELLTLILRPLADPRRHAPAFYNQLRLVGLDATEFSLVNTPGILGKMRKAATRKGQAAFAKLRMSALVELFAHNPLAAAVGWEGESEMSLSRRVLENLPRKCLMLGDRLYGCAAFLVAAGALLAERNGHYLVRARTGIKVHGRRRRLADGSWGVRVPIRDPEGGRAILGFLELREIWVTATRPGHKPVRVRLWTSLMDPMAAPAKDLARLYLFRWEHELFFRELKTALPATGLLSSQTVDTAGQEVAAMLIGAAIMAEERSALETGVEPEHRVSLLKTMSWLEPLWLTFAICGHLLSPDQKRAMVEGFRERIRQASRNKRRVRSCPRAVRQPIGKWPRKTDQASTNIPFKLKITRGP